MRRAIWWLSICLLVCALPAAAQFFNLARVSRPSETTFANSGQPWPLLGTINAENYDAGGANIAFAISNLNTLPACQALPYRADAANLQTSSDGPAYQIGCAVAGNAYQYIVNVPTPSPCPCTVTPRLGSSSAGGSWALYIDGILVTTVSTPNTGGNTTMQGVASASFNLAPGNHVVRWQSATGDGSGYAGSMSSFQFAQATGPPGPAVTTFTMVNYTGSTLPAGTAVSFGQAFRYDDIKTGNFPLIRDASTHAVLTSQWDERSTWIENGGDGSWRHAVWAAWLPVSVAAGATYQFEFVPTSGTYSATSHQPLSALCSGPAAHDLKIHLTDVRNQSDTVRDSGDATFRVCDNINNVGRDAPRHLRQGPVYDEYLVSGMFVYTGAGHKDPLLYAQAIIDISTQSSDGVSAGDVRWVFHVHNSWENVAAGTAGNAGSSTICNGVACPVGFANDPQTISYRAEIDDGASDVLDWSGLDATVTSASNPIISTSAGCSASTGNWCMSVPSSTGANQWYYGQATRAACSATCPAGITSGQLYYAYPAASGATSNTVTNYVQLMLGPSDIPNCTGCPSPFFMTGSQGTGTTSFSTRFQHYHWSTWQTLDATGLSNLSPFGTSTRVTKKVYPAFTMAEKRYWEETGLIIPLNLAQTPTVTPQWNQALGPNYEPYGRGNVIGFQGPGTRPDLGSVSEWAAQCFITMTQHDCDNARLFTLATSTHGYGTLLNEATGRLPAVNNGPPTGPGGNGVGGSYAGLGAPQPNLMLNGGGSCLQESFSLVGLAAVPHNQPNANFPADIGLFGCGTYISHMPSFNGFTYEIFGDRNFLDVMRWHGNQDYLQQRAGPGPSLGQGYWRDNNAKFTDGNTYHYYGLLTDCCQVRGSAHLFRDIIYPATFGSDSDIERSYFHDFLKETSNYYPLWLKFKDGSGSPNYSTSILTPDAPGDSVVQDTFIQSYVATEGAWMMTTFLHEPLGGQWMTKYQRFEEGVLGGQLPNAPVSYYGIDFNSECCVQNGDDGTLTSQSDPAGTGNYGPAMNGTDAADFGAFAAFSSILTGGQLGGGNRYTYAAGDSLKVLTAFPFLEGRKIDQLNGNTWYKILGPVNNSVSPATFFLQCPSTQAAGPGCPTPGSAFTFFSIGGVTINNDINDSTLDIKYRLAFDPGPGNGYVDAGYDQYGGQILSALKILGYSIPHALADFASRDGGNTIGAASPGGFYNPNLPSNWWDQTIVIPGLPPAVNGIIGSPIPVPAAAQAAGFTTLAANYDFSQPTYAAQSNWLDCSDSNTALPWHAGVPGVASASCNIFQSVDPVTGQTVMHFQQLPSDGAGKFMGMQTKVGSTITVGFQNYYVEAVYRIGPSCTAPANTCGPNGVWTWNDDSVGSHIEWDFMEEYGDSGGFADGSPQPPGWFSYATNNLPGGYSVFNYHKVSSLITSDGSTSKLDCGYVDDRLQQCAAATDTNSSIYSTKFWLIASTQSGADALTPNGNIDMYLQYIRVWTCPAYQTSACNAATLFNGSQDGETLTYWHGLTGATILPSPPSGFHWAQTFGDEFSTTFANSGTSGAPVTLDTSKWQLDHFCGNSNFTHYSSPTYGCGGTNTASDTVSGGVLTMTIQSGAPATRNIIDTAFTASPSNTTEPITPFQQRYGYFVYDAKLPTCPSNEFDLESFGGTGPSGSPVGELGWVSQKNGACNYRNLRSYQGSNGSFTFFSDPDLGMDITADFHQYGLLWVNDATAHGSVTVYFDGSPVTGPNALISSAFDSGLYFDIYWDPCVGCEGGTGTDPLGSTMQFDWIRAYQLAPN